MIGAGPSNVVMSAGLEPPGGWAGPSSPRITPDAKHRLFLRLATLGARAIGRPEPTNIMLTLHRSPRLFWPWLLFASRFMPFGTIDALDRERIILRVAWNCRCRYEWAQHLDLARRLGLRPEDVSRVAEGPDAGWAPLQAALLRAADEIHHDRCIGDATWEILAARFDEPHLLELCLLIGHYEMLAAFLNSSGVALERLS